jgi:RNA polymerase sigma-70 factor (ECF subfamily)
MLEVREGRVERLEVLFDRHHRPLYNFFLRMTGNSGTAEDLVQEVFLRILRYRQTYRAESAFTTWMYQIARNAGVDHFRKRKHEAEAPWETAVPDSAEMYEPASSEPGVGHRLEQGQHIALLEKALAALPRDRRELLVMVRYQDLKYEQVAEILGTNTNAVKARVFRAMQELSERFGAMSRKRAVS